MIKRVGAPSPQRKTTYILMAFLCRRKDCREEETRDSCLDKHYVEKSGEFFSSHVIQIQGYPIKPTGSRFGTDKMKDVFIQALMEFCGP